MKLVGLISDTHVPSRSKNLPTRVFDIFKDVNLIIHAGDFEEYSIATKLGKIAPFMAVRGNMCNQDVKNRFPVTRTVTVEDLVIGIYHGSGGPDGFIERVAGRFQGLTPPPDIIACGHTHQPLAVQHGDMFIINPGSPTDRVFAPYNSVALLQIEGKDFDHEIIKLG